MTKHSSQEARFDPNVRVGIGMVGLALLASACAPAATPAPPAPATAAPVVLASHAPGVEHQDKPKRLEAYVELDLNEMSFDSPRGEKNPVFRLPVGKTVGLHIHNEGKILHEVAIGRGTLRYEESEQTRVPAGYEQNLFDQVQSDIFVYVGADKIEIEEAKFGELELPAGVRDFWIRFEVPVELKGEWSLACFIPGHYESGMRAKLVFE